MLSVIKYDEYGNFGPGAKFVESLAGWLQQFPEKRRQLALDFVLDELVFISETEMSHLHHSRRHRGHDSRVTGAGRHQHGHRSPPHPRDRTALRVLQLRRASLIIGASDGARLDRFVALRPLSRAVPARPRSDTAQISPLAENSRRAATDNRAARAV